MTIFEALWHVPDEKNRIAHCNVSSTEKFTFWGTYLLLFPETGNLRSQVFFSKYLSSAQS